MLSKWLFLLIIDCDLVADLANAVAGCLSDCMIVSERLRNVVLSDRVGHFTDDLLATITKDLSPCLNAVVADTLCDIISVKTHPWDERLIELVIIFLSLTVFDHHEEGASAET